MANVVDQMDEIITEARTSNAKKKKTQTTNKYKFVDFLKQLNIKQHLDNNKKARLWNLRNLEYGSVLADSLELDYFIFQQNIYVEESKELVEKLKRLGFVNQTDYPDEKLYKPFCKTMYYTKYNISLSLYKPHDRESIVTAYNIVPRKLEGNVGLVVFLSAINELMKK